MNTVKSKKNRNKALSKRMERTVQYNHLAHLSRPVPVMGSDISKVSETFGLHLSEIGLMTGLNTSALYEKKKKNDAQPANISILLRLYAALPEYISSIKPPPIEELIQKIQDVDPEFEKSSIGMLLGLEKNSSFRLRRDGLENGSQTTKVLSHLINLIITNEPLDWYLIKEIVETESAARKITPPESIWTEGGWDKNIDSSEQSNKDKSTRASKIILSSNLETDSE